MGEKIRGHIRSNVVGYVALFFALSGGAAWATHPGGANTISSGDIVNGEVRSADIASANVQNSDIGGSAVTGGKIAPGTVQGSDVQNDDLDGTDIADTNSLGSPEIGEANLFNDNSLGGEDIDESSLGEVPLATQASTATTANNLDRGSVYIKTNSVVVPGGSQDAGNGNGVSRAVSVQCNNTDNNTDFDAKDIAVGGGAFWSGNANSNSNELENRIHSAAFITQTTAASNPATSEFLPAGYRVRGEVDKDGDDTLTVQVVCFPAEP